MPEVLTIAATRWPRLYLDTAEILYIADGRADPGILDALLVEMRARGVLLVIGIEHFEDALPRADFDAASKLADALERFPYRMLATEEPGEVEPWLDGRHDIVIEPVANIRELITAPAAAPALERRTTVARVLHEGNSQYQQARLDQAGTAHSRVEQEVFLKALVVLTGGRFGTDVDAILTRCEQECGARLSENSRERMRELLRAPAHVLGAVQSELEANPSVRQTILGRLRISFDPEAYRDAPGLFLASRVANCRARNLGRLPQLSDQIDGQHAAYFPYVDIATCDRQTYACVEPHLGKPTFPRQVTLIRNGRLHEVLRAVELLPSQPPLTAA